jgi:hypothetical protein
MHDRIKKFGLSAKAKDAARIVHIAAQERSIQSGQLVIGAITGHSFEQKPLLTPCKSWALNMNVFQ